MVFTFSAGVTKNCGAGQHADARGFRIEHGARAQNKLVAERVGEFFERLNRAGNGHGDFSGANASAIDGFDGANCAFRAGGSNHGDDSDIQNGAENDFFLHFLLVYPQKL